MRLLRFSRDKGRVPISATGSRQHSRLYGASGFNRVLPLVESGVDAPVHDYRSCFQLDLDRVLNSFGWRRLAYKTQLFPVGQNDFVRSRMTHSLEVMQVGKTIAHCLNSTKPELRDDPINIDLIQVAGLCHDIGHPPFGHMGERTLNECMLEWGGFEGNAQTLRLLTKLEHGEPQEPAILGQEAANDDRAGLNLSYRSIASVIKYDHQIPDDLRKNPGKVSKGYFPDERKLVDACRANVLSRSGNDTGFPTLECQIMDLADDIAYSVFDLEDSFKTGYLTPIGMISARQQLIEAAAALASKALKTTITPDEIRKTLAMVFKDVLNGGSKSDSLTREVAIHAASRDLASSPFHRASFSNRLVRWFTSSIQFSYNSKCPARSQVWLPDDVKLIVEVLKAFVFNAVVQTPEIQVTEFKGALIVRELFEALAKDNSVGLFPQGPQARIREAPTKRAKMRSICDFIADMTDVYATELYGRLKSVGTDTIYKPV